ncbi:MAG: hypothetical protein AB7T38_02600 [Nitrospirales bacterium]
MSLSLPVLLMCGLDWDGPKIDDKKLVDRRKAKRRRKTARWRKQRPSRWLRQQHLTPKLLRKMGMQRK